jgi:uncharacterized protein (TIGR02265 family)
VDGFVEPPWDAPLDLDAELRRVPETAKQKGMFLIPMVLEAKKLGHSLPSARERYVPFQDYPLREHVQLLVESARVLFPQQSLRQALRRLGRAAHKVFVESTVGKVVWAGVTDAPSALDAILKGYTISVPGCATRVVERGPNHARVRMERIYYFLDCHHVGCIEGAVRATGAEPKVRIKMDSATSGDFLCEW